MSCRLPPPPGLLVVLLWLATAWMVAGCQAAPVQVAVQQVRVPVPVECQEDLPDRPNMPTEHLRPGGGLDAFAQAAMAEIDRREAYEGKLLAALENCRKPVGVVEGATR